MRAKREYKINSNLTTRLTEKSGATDEVIDFLNEQEPGTVGREVIKAIKYWIRMKDENDRIRKTIEEEAMKMELNLARYGNNRGPYKKSDESELKRELERLRRENAEYKAANAVTIQSESSKASKVTGSDEKKKVKNTPNVAKKISLEEIQKQFGNEEPKEPKAPKAPKAESSFEDELYNADVQKSGRKAMANALNSIRRS